MVTDNPSNHSNSRIRLSLFTQQHAHCVCSNNCTPLDCVLIRETSKLILATWQKSPAFPINFILGSTPENSFGSRMHISKWPENLD